jgi:hypothetical protein
MPADTVTELPPLGKPGRGPENIFRRTNGMDMASEIKKPLAWRRRKRLNRAVQAMMVWLDERQ